MKRQDTINFIQSKMFVNGISEQIIDQIPNRSDEELYLLCCIRRQANNNGFIKK